MHIKIDTFDAQCQRINKKLNRKETGFLQPLLHKSDIELSTAR
jgi:hypothetical protein